MSEEKKRTTIYWTKITLRKMQEICRREHSTVSAKLEALALPYIQAHSRGNPQLQILSYTEAPNAPQPMRTKCLFIGGVILSEGTLYCRRAGMWVPGVRCYSCAKNELRKSCV